MIDRNRLVQTLVGVYGFYDRELTEFALRIWLDALADRPIEDVERAFAAHLRDPQAGRFCPKPADILGQLLGSVEDAATMQWTLVLLAARSGGGFTADMTEATRQAVHSLGGWGAICRSDESQNGFLQRRFCDAYGAYARRDAREADALEIGRDAVRRIGSVR